MSVQVERFQSAANVEHAAAWTKARWVTPLVAVGVYRDKTVILIDDSQERSNA